MVTNYLNYKDAQALCLNDYQQFWALEAKRISWNKDFSKVHDGGFAQEICQRFIVIQNSTLNEFPDQSSAYAALVGTSP